MTKAYRIVKIIWIGRACFYTRFNVFIHISNNSEKFPLNTILCDLNQRPLGYIASKHFIRSTKTTYNLLLLFIYFWITVFKVYIASTVERPLRNPNWASDITSFWLFWLSLIHLFHNATVRVMISGVSGQICLYTIECYNTPKTTNETAFWFVKHIIGLFLNGYDFRHLIFNICYSI